MSNKTLQRRAQDRMAPFVEKIIALGGQCFEQTVEKEPGVVIERWIVKGLRVVVYGTPLWVDLYHSTRSASESLAQAIEEIERGSNEQT